MSVEEYINQNLPFYHITPSSNIESILKNGIEARRCDAICVIRSNSHEVWKEIIHGQLKYSDDYAIIKIEPQKHSIMIGEVAPDSTEEDGTGPLQNYIVKSNIKVDIDDFVEMHFYRGIRPDFNNIRNLVLRLEGYKHAPIPDVSILNNV